MKKTDAYAQQALQQTLAELQVNPDRGLESADVAKRLQEYGYNEIREHGEPLWHRVFRRF